MLVQYYYKMYKDSSKTRNVQAHVNLIRDPLSALTLQTNIKFELRWLSHLNYDYVAGIVQGP